MADIAPLKFAPGGVDITLTPPASLPLVGLALALNTEFPDAAFADGAIPLGSIGASADHEFALDGVKFLDKLSVGGKLFAGFGVYRSGDKLAADLKAEGLNGFDEPAVGGPLFVDDATKNLYALRWGYDATASASGSIALGAGPVVSFGASGRTAGLYALVRSIDRTAPARDSIADTLTSWKLPRGVASPADLEPGTWVVAETDGEVQFNLGLEYGYNYSWARESLKLGGLTGDLGLKIDMGVKAQLGFSASGRYATVVSREGAGAELRLRVFRMRQHGWSFAVDANVGATVKQNVIPDNFDDFIRGVFNVNGQQVLQDFISTFDEWTNPANNLADLLGGKLVDYAEDLVRKATGIEDLQQPIGAAVGKLKDAVALWHSLPHDLNSLLYGLLRDAVPLDTLRDFLKTVVTLSDPRMLSHEIAGMLRGVGFYETPAGKWLTAEATEGILTLLANLPAISDATTRLADLKAHAEKTLAILDGSAVENTLRGLQKLVDERLGLDKIMGVADELSFDKIDEWLKQRLSDFIGHTVVFAELKKIQEAVIRLKSSAADFYAKGYKALAEKYTAEFHYSFQKTSTRTALIDVSFDFTANPEGAGELFRSALGGDFKRLLAEEIPGVKLHRGVVTHEMKRRTHVEVGLPFFSAAVDHITESKAEGQAVDTADGRLWVFTLDAKDEVLRKHSLNKLSISLQFSRKPGLRQFSDEDFKYRYRLLAVKRAAPRKYVADSFSEAAQKYFPSEFTDASGHSFDDYLDALGDALAALKTGGRDSFGDLLTSLEVSVPGRIFSAWKNVPADKQSDIYMRMSQRMQNVLRQLLPVCYFQNPDRYKETAAAYPLLAYSALKPFNTFGDSLVLTKKDIYAWDFIDDDFRSKVLHKFAADNLRNKILPRVRDEMNGMPEVALYADSKVDDILNFRVGSASEVTKARENFKSLARNEADVIHAAQNAALSLRASLDSADLDAAAEKLTGFGSTLVDAFNNKVGDGRYEGSAFRPLGSLLFIEATRYFDFDLVADIKPTAMLEFIILKKQSAFVFDSFLTGARPEASDTVLQQRIVSTGDSSL
jgi:hypothetical protein